MNNQMQIFQHEQFGDIRTVVKDNEPWFVGKDVAEALGYKEPSKAAREKVDPDDRGMSKIDTPSGAQEMTIINESGLYSLVLSSKLPGAKQFKRWVTSEVLPSIRKHGAYMTEETLKKALTTPDFIIDLATALKEEQSKRRELEAAREADRPKVLFAEAVSASSSSILVGDMAKILRQNGVEIGQVRLFQWLRDKGYLIRQKGTSWNMPTQRSMEMGLFEIKETTISHADGHISAKPTPKVTGKGQQYFISKFLEKEKKTGS